MTLSAIAISYQGVIIRYAHITACVIFGYDYALTFSQEIEHIWKRRFTLPTVAFLILRYVTPLELVFSVGVFFPPVVATLSCNTILHLVGSLNIIAVNLISSIMIIRTIALYNRNRLIIGLLSILMMGQIVVITTSIGEVKVIVGSGYRGCITESPPLLADLYITSLWWCPLVIDTTIFVLTVIRLRSLHKGSHQSYSLFQVIMRDGVSYYMIICLVYTLNTLNWTLNSGPSKIAGTNLGLAIPAISMCRLTLNLQGIHSRSEDTLNNTFDAVSGVLTTAPSVLNLNRPANGTVWLTGEKWDTIYLGDSAVEERDPHMAQGGQTLTT